MFVNAQTSVSVQPTARTDMDPTTAAASALYSGMLQQATPPAANTPQANSATQSDALSDFKDYMSKSPEQRLRDSILKELGLTEEDLKNLPPERQMAINQEITQRMQDKVKLAKEEQQQSKDSVKPLEEKFLASL
ncbi:MULTISPECIES: hypothetical protein [unclassified Pseudomonas]|uniref:hypothetical protein n=1 Tax=unclassified Pseudomonas TaxID=196821 RepID=UPI000CCFFFB5|nr:MULTISPECIES: hypothetical protein [unclassified Pseudomonas]POA51384.1 hypothetical protein C1889_27650 [Pseudomonas sp. FW507-12TSA]